MAPHDCPWAQTRHAQHQHGRGTIEKMQSHHFRVKLFAGNVTIWPDDVWLEFDAHRKSVWVVVSSMPGRQLLE